MFSRIYDSSVFNIKKTFQMWNSPTFAFELYIFALLLVATSLGDYIIWAKAS